MSFDKQPSTDVSDKVATLRRLLENPSNRRRVVPLATLLMARDIDMHGEMLEDLRERVQRMKESLHSGSAHTSDVELRMQVIEQDATALRHLVQNHGQKDMEAKITQDQLKTALSEAMEQRSVEIASIGERLETIKELVETQQKHTDDVQGVLDSFGQGMECLQHNVDELKRSFSELPPNSPIAQYIAKLEGKMSKCFEENQRGAEDMKLFLESLKAQRNPCGDTQDQCFVDVFTGRPSNNDLISHPLPTGTGTSMPKRPRSEDWPAIVSFLATYEQCKEIYKIEPPKNEPKFISGFLDKINIHVSCALQRHLLELYPNKVALAVTQVAQKAPDIFINLDNLRWQSIRYAIRKFKDLRILQWAVNERISGPPQNRVLDQRSE